MLKFSLPTLALLLCSAVASADTVTLSNGDKLTGTITEVNPDKIIITTPYAGPITLDRKAVQTMQSDKPVAIVGAAPEEKKEAFVGPTADSKAWKESAVFVPTPPPPPPPRHTSWLQISPDWNNQFAIGILNTTGNDETTTVVGSLSFHYEKKPDELTLKFEGNYGTTNGTQTAGFFDQNLVYRHDINDKTYLYAGDDARYDAIKGISLQATGTGGIGYWFIRNDKMKLDGRAGLGAQYQRNFDSTESTDMVGELGFRFVYVLNERVDLYTDNVYVVGLTDTDNWHIHSDTGVNVKLDVERGLGLKLGFVDDYENQVSAGAKNNDTRLMLSLTLDF